MGLDQHHQSQAVQPHRVALASSAPRSKSQPSGPRDAGPRKQPHSDQVMAELTDKQQVFIEYYLSCWNATEAARQAGYKNPNQVGPENLVKLGIQERIQERLTELKMGADEVLTRLSDHARGSIKPFMRRGPDGELHGFDLGDDKPFHLLHKVSITKRTIKEVTEEKITLELYDAQAALVHLGRHHKLFTDRTELTGKDGAPIGIQAIDYRSGLAALAPGSMDDSDPSGES
jgi:hypothetical protein